MTTRAVVLGLVLSLSAAPALAAQSHPAIGSGGADGLVHGPIEIPLEVVDGRLIVPVKSADGTSMDFALSTGNASTVLTESSAVHVSGGHGLMAGDLPVNLENSVTLPDEDLASYGDVAGLIGANTFNEYDILIDAPNERLLVKPVSNGVSWPGVELSEPVRLTVHHGVVISLQARMKGERVRGALDIGSPSLIASPALGAALGIDGTGTADLELGDVTFAGLPVSVSDLDIFQRWDPAGTGFVLVGTPMAADCAISVSWAFQELRTCVR